MLNVKNLCKIYSPNNANVFHALTDINLHVNRGEAVILSGISGSGKSTLLSIMAAMDKPTSGEVIVDSTAISKLPDLHASAYRSHHIGFIFQHFNLLEALSVKENVALPLIPQNLDNDTISSNVATAMRLAHIDHKADANVHELSGGEKQRCAIARALVNDPKLILCDEPTANLDRENSLHFIESLRELKTLGKTIIVATHDPLFERVDFIDTTVHISDGAIRE
ncbi:MAG: ABC transporter ATP-binding protein [Campylobacterota bacterium]|nr:ABC transporter ATP-binding protein [Campylobacterota bacterium]